MSSTYGGDATKFPDLVTLIADGDSATASNLNTGPVGVLDRTAWLKEDVGHLGALNFSGPRAISGNPTLRWATYVPFSRKWFLFGDARHVRASIDGGTDWGTSTSLDSAGAGTEAFRVADYDAVGRVLVTIATTGAVHHLASAAAPSTWTAVTVVALTAVSKPHVVYSPTAARWCWSAVDNVGTGATRIYTSTDRTTWTVGGSAGFPAIGAASEMCMGVNKTSGRIVLARHDAMGGAFNFYMSTSDDGGQTWTLRASKQVGSLGSTKDFSLTYHPDRAEWLLMLGDVSNSDTQAWTSSDDGLTWTLKASLTSSALLHPAPVKAGWVASTTAGDLVYSVDGAATWRYAGISVAATTPAGVFGSFDNGQILTLSNDATNTNIRFATITGVVGAALT